MLDNKNVKINYNRAVIGCKYIIKHPELFSLFIETRYKSVPDVINVINTRGGVGVISRSTVYNVRAFIEFILDFKGQLDKCLS